MTTTEQAPATRELDPAALTTWAKLREIQTRIADLTVEAETLKAQLREHLGVGEFTVAGKKMFTISRQRRFDPALAERILTAEEVAACTVPVLDRSLVQRTVSPERYAAMQVESGKPTVRSA